MLRTGALRIVASVMAVAALLTGALSVRSGARQTELMNTTGFPYDAFDALPQTDLKIPGAVIHVAFAPGAIALPKHAIFDWIRRSAHAVTVYYGHFPVTSYRLLIMPIAGSGVDGGTTWGYNGAATRIMYGADSDAQDLRQDWVMVHEMVHLALPDMNYRYNWLSEGLAVYVEPIARVQAGDLQAREIWTAMRRDMPKGLPHLGDRGLDNTPTWGRTYWGGALFCLLADIEIRKATNNRLGLQDAMRGVLSKGNHESEWPIRDVLEAADQAVGLHVMTRLYERMGPKAVRTDMDGLWRNLGVEGNSGLVDFDNAAPLAATRAAVTRLHAS